jgi:hypothetical protein
MKKSLLFIVLVLVSRLGLSMDAYDEIANAIRSGDARQLSAFFGNTVELTLLNQENIYSKAQAELILKDFFSKNTPKSFRILHNGASPEGTQYAIGNLVTTNGKTFRTSFYFKNNKGKIVLQELRIETE